MPEKINETEEYIQLEDILNMPNVNQEILSKVMFFLKNSNDDQLDPSKYMVSIIDGKIINLSEEEIINVVKNDETNDYKIVRIKKEPSKEQQGIKPIAHPPETGIAKTNEMVKIRRLEPPKQGLDNAAFAKISILVTICMLTALLVAYLILKLK